MKDWAKFLYETHCESIRRNDPQFIDYIIPWTELSPETRRAWDMTAQAMLKELS